LQGGREKDLLIVLTKELILKEGRKKNKRRKVLHHFHTLCVVSEFFHVRTYCGRILH
jgi:hypothetical protein